MLRLRKTTVLTAALMILIGALAVSAQDYEGYYDDDYERDLNRQYDNDRYYERSQVDRYLDVEVWTDHSDAEYYEGDNVVIYFRANRDAFVAIYSIDSRGLVNLMFPYDPAQDNFIRGGVTYSLPGPDDDFDLVINGPSGVENIQIIASRERFPIPPWYNNSGLICDAEDRNDYMDWLNERYFVRYDGQRFAYDRAVIFVEEWEPSYFRPVYWPHYPSWALYGNVYVDYWWGSSVYINGYYWGVTPLYIPRLLVGWHTITIYDRYGHCWESDFHCSRYHTMVFDKSTIIPVSTVRSKYKDVRTVGWRDPVKHGYPDYTESVVVKKAIRSGLASSPAGVTKDVRRKVEASSSNDFKSANKKYVRGDSKLVKTDRGYETRSVTRSEKSTRSSTRGSTYSSDRSGSSGKYSKSRSSSGSSSSSYRKGSSGSSYKSSGSSSGYYQKKSGSSSSKSSRSSSVGTKSTKSSRSSTSSSSSKSVKSKSSTKSSSSKSSSVKSPSTKSSSSKSSSSKSSKSRSSKSSSSKSSKRR